MTAHDDGETMPLLVAEAFAALERAKQNCAALGASLDSASNALRVARLVRHVDQMAKLQEFHRLVAVRVDVMARRVGEDTP